MLDGLGESFLRPWLGVLPDKGVLDSLPEAQRRRLESLLLRKLGAHSNPSNGRTSSLPEGSKRAVRGRLETALRVNALQGESRQFADAVLDAWTARSDVPGSLPDSSEELLSRCFGPLAEECERQLKVRLQSRHWKQRGLEQRLDELERSLT